MAGAADNPMATPPAAAPGGADAANAIARYKMIAELGQLVTSEVNLEALFELIIRQTTRIMACEKASVFLLDPQRGQLWAWVSTDLTRNSIRISQGCGLAGWALCSRAPVICNDPYRDPRFYPGVDAQTGCRTRNILCVPLINRQQACIGTLQALNKPAGDFTEQDQDLLTAASYYITIALENARLYEELRALDRARERVIHHLSHEIRTPLAIIGGVLSRLRRILATGAAADSEKIIRRGERNLERLLSLQAKIDDILSCRAPAGEAAVPDANPARLARDLLRELLAEAEEDFPEVARRLAERLLDFDRRREIVAEPVALEPLLQAVCDRAEAAMAARQLCIMRRLEGGAQILIDRRVLESVCEGLIKNAIENTPDEGVIEIGARHHGDEIRLTVADRGVGISPENQAQIMSGFFHTQPNDSYSSLKPYQFNAGGAGADLLRIRSLAARLGFRVEFTSRRCPFLQGEQQACPGRISACRFIESPGECLGGSGSTFVVSFPPAAR